MTNLISHTPHPLLRRLQWIHKRPSPGALAGDYRSAFRGRGVEFDQVVKYTYGDDMRTIDWNVTARRGEPYRKQYIEERELTLHVLFEDSPGMAFGSGIKTRRETALDLFALITHLCVQNRDRLAITYLSGQLQWYERPVRGRSKIYALAHRLLESAPSKSAALSAEQLSRTLRACLKVLPKHTIFLWVSDHAPRPVPMEWALMRKKFVCIGVRPDDPWDRATPRSGVFPVVDPLSEQILTLDWASSSVRRQHEAWRKARDEFFQELFPSEFDRMVLPPEASLPEVLFRFFQKRKTGGGS